MGNLACFQVSCLPEMRVSRHGCGIPTSAVFPSSLVGKNSPTILLNHCGYPSSEVDRDSGRKSEIFRSPLTSSA
jgi:hypothetical protein